MKNLIKFLKVETPENLICRFHGTYNSVLRYGDCFIVTAMNWKGFTEAAIYKVPELDGSIIESPADLVAVADEQFPDSGHAAAWAINHILNGGI